ncbi:MAG: glycogen synthase [Gaiellaceae bacterium]
MKIALLTREWPPHVYGGAGVHVVELARALEQLRLVELEVRCFGEDADHARGFEPWTKLAGANEALRTLSVDLAMAADLDGAQLVHSHTWYANLAGHLAKLVHGVPHVATTHSLEPHRPWKADQLGGGYAVSSLVERTALEGADAVIAVSSAMRDDVLEVYPAIEAERVHVILNGIDTEKYRPDGGTDVLERYGVDPARPSVVFVGRITHQKGIEHLLEAADRFDRSAQLVLAAGAADTVELGRLITRRVEELQAERDGVFWIQQMLEQREVIQLLSHASVFACPSVYEPLGIVNLEAMACGAAVVASAVGGIPEVVVDRETGLLVPPGDPGALAAAVNELVSAPERARAMGEAGRRRAVESFRWGRIAEQTAELYRSLR